jgi:hypothetical protein
MQMIHARFENTVLELLAYYLEALLHFMTMSHRVVISYSDYCGRNILSRA